MKFEGGFQGRTNKLVDGCYSFWQGALVQVTQMLIEKSSCQDGYTINIDELLFHREALQEYVLICCQKPNGGEFSLSYLLCLLFIYYYLNKHQYFLLIRSCRQTRQARRFVSYVLLP